MDKKISIDDVLNLFNKKGNITGIDSTVKSIDNVADITNNIKRVIEKLYKRTEDYDKVKRPGDVKKSSAQESNYYEAATKFFDKLKKFLDNKPAISQDKLNFKTPEAAQEALRIIAERNQRIIYGSLLDNNGKVFFEGGLMANMDLFAENEEQYIEQVSQRLKDKLASPWRLLNYKVKSFLNVPKAGYKILSALFKDKSTEIVEEAKNQATTLSALNRAKKVIKSPATDLEIVDSHEPVTNKTATLLPVLNAIRENTSLFAPNNRVLAPATGTGYSSGEIISNTAKTEMRIEESNYRSRVTELLTSIRDNILQTGNNTISTIVKGAGSGGLLSLLALKFIKPLLAKVSTATKGLAQFIKRPFTFITALSNKLAKDLFGAVKNTISKAFNFVSAPLKPLLKPLTSLLSTVSHIGSVFSKVFSGITNAIKPITTFGSNLLSIGGAISKAGSAFSFIGKALSIVLRFAKFVPILGTVLSAFDFIKDFFAGSNRATDWLGRSDATAKLASGIGGAIGGDSMLGNALKFGGIGATLGGILGSIFPGVGNVVGAVLGGVLGAGVGALLNLIGPDKIAKLTDSAIGWVSNIWTSISGSVTGAFSAVTGIVYSVGQSIGSRLKSALNFYSNLGQTVINSVTSVWTNHIRPFFNWIGNAFNVAGEWTTKLWSFIKPITPFGIAELIWTNLSKFSNSISSWFKSVFSVEAFQAGLEKVYNVFGSFSDFSMRIRSTLIGYIKSSIRNVLEVVPDWLADKVVPDRLLNWLNEDNDKLKANEIVQAVPHIDSANTYRTNTRKAESGQVITNYYQTAATDSGVDKIVEAINSQSRVAAPVYYKVEKVDKR